MRSELRSIRSFVNPRVHLGMGPVVKLQLRNPLCLNLIMSWQPGAVWSASQVGEIHGRSATAWYCHRSIVGACPKIRFQSHIKEYKYLHSPQFQVVFWYWIHVEYWNDGIHSVHQIWSCPKLDVWKTKTTKVVSHFPVYCTMQLGWRYRNILFQEYLETGNMKTNYPLHRSQETLQIVMPYAYLCPTCTNSNLMSIHQRRLHSVPVSRIRRFQEFLHKDLKSASFRQVWLFHVFHFHLIIQSLVHSASFYDRRHCPKQKHNRRLIHLKTRRIKSYIANFTKNASVWISTKSMKSEDCAHLCFLRKKIINNNYIISLIYSNRYDLGPSKHGHGSNWIPFPSWLIGIS